MNWYCAFDRAFPKTDVISHVLVLILVLFPGDATLAFSGGPGSASFIRTPQSQIVALAEKDTILRCDFSYPGGRPVSHIIEWSKKEHDVPIFIMYQGYPPHIGEGYEGRLGLAGSESGEKASLLIKKIQREDEGWYECKGEASKRETLFSIGKPLYRKCGDCWGYRRLPTSFLQHWCTEFSPVIWWNYSFSVQLLNRPPETPKNGSWVYLVVHGKFLGSKKTVRGPRNGDVDTNGRGLTLYNTAVLSP